MVKHGGRARAGLSFMEGLILTVDADDRRLALAAPPRRPPPPA